MIKTCSIIRSNLADHLIKVSLNLFFVLVVPTLLQVTFLRFYSELALSNVIACDWSICICSSTIIKNWFTYIMLQSFSKNQHFILKYIIRQQSHRSNVDSIHQRIIEKLNQKLQVSYRDYSWILISRLKP